MNVNSNPYVINTEYKPFSMQEMLTPFLLYKDAWDKSQEQMDKYNQGADAFSYLDETLPEGSKARSIYDNYSKDLRNAEQSFSQNGLTADNSRALLGLRRRYTGEIGRLEKASTKLEKLRNLRMAQDAQDPTMIYTVDNPTIDDVLDDKNFNQYGISGDSLYKRGMQAGAAISQRHFSNLELQKMTNNPAFLDAVQKVGFTPEVLHAFNVNPDAIPEFKEAITSIMKSTGADANLKGAKNEQAVQNVIRGLIDGAVYKRSDSLQQNPEVLTAAQQAEVDYRNAELKFRKEEADKEDKYKQWMYDFDKDGNITGFSKAYKDAIAGEAGKGGYTINSKSKLVKSKIASAKSKMTPAQKAAYAEAEALNSKLVDNKNTNKKLLKSKNGFDITTKKNGYHYNYVGKITKGKASKDNPNHYTWDAELPNDKGEFETDFGDDVESMRVLTDGEMYNLLHNHSGFTTQFRRIGAKINATNNDDARIVEVTNSDGDKEYFVAVNKRK